MTTHIHNDDFHTTDSIKTYRDALQEFFNQRYDWCITINVGDNISLHRFRKDVDHLWNKLDRKLIGSGYHKVEAERRSRIVTIAENTLTNVHAHGILYISPAAKVRSEARILEVMNTAWQQMHPQGHVELEFPYYRQGWSRYITKHARPWNYMERLIIAGEGVR